MKGSLGNIFGAPLAIGALGLVGLTSALLGDGWLDVVSWIALSIPLAILVWLRILRRS
jgi:hypothetical protein